MEQTTVAQQKWRTGNGMPVQQPVTEAIRLILMKEKEEGHELKVCIGTDSQVKGKTTLFATAIVFIRKGKGGFMFVHTETTTQKMSIKQRMLQEVSMSVTTAFELCSIFTAFNVDMEVHADINTNPAFKSNDAFKDAMGYIMGMGFAFRAKPDAFASSSCANKIVH